MTVVHDDVTLPIAEELAATGRWLYGHGWSPATSSNYSCRIDENRIALTTSGKDKGRLQADDIMIIDSDGNPLSAGKPSAETALHTQLYQLDESAGAVLHTHSTYATVLSRRLRAGSDVVLDGFEIAKAFAGIDDHQTPLRIPIFANTQDMTVLSRDVEQWLVALDANTPAVAYLIQGHGLYTWAVDLPAARRHIEALEFCLQCRWLETVS